jgi:hypothetical protein
MILFPLTTTWIWLHILTASSFLSLARSVQETWDGGGSLQPAPFEGD